MNNSKNHPITSAKLQQVFFFIFLILSIFLCLTLFSYYKINSKNDKIIALMNDVRLLRASLQATDSGTIANKLTGSIEIEEVYYISLLLDN